MGGQLARCWSDPQIQDLLAATVARARAKESRLVALRVMEKARVKEMPPVWIPALVLVLEGKDPDLIREAVAAARASAVPKERAAELTDALQRVATHAIGHVGLEIVGARHADQPFGVGELVDQIFRLGELDISRGAGTRWNLYGIGLRERVARCADGDRVMPCVCSAGHARTSPGLKIPAPRRHPL